jgi:hypothetical protein
MATTRNGRAPTKAVATKAAASRRRSTPAAKRVSDIPGDIDFDWHTVYPAKVKLYRFVSNDNRLVCLPRFEQPGEGEIFGLMLLEKSDQEMLVGLMRDLINQHAKSPEYGLRVTYEALRTMHAEGTVSDFLEGWAKDAGIEVEKSVPLST